MTETTLNCQEAQELITGLIDGELSAQEFALIQAHFYTCVGCPRTFEQELALKRWLRDAALGLNAPSTLKARMGNDRKGALTRFRLSKLAAALSRPAHFTAPAAVLVALLAIPVVTARFWLSSSHAPVVPGLFQSYQQIVQGKIVPVQITSLTDLKSHLTELTDRQFAPMAYDFSTMNIHLAGGLLRQIAKRKVLVTVYQRSDSMIVCYTFLGSEGDAPEFAEIFFDSEKAMNFHQFSDRRTNAVMHREGNLLCVLMARIPMPDLLQLARAKAQSS